LPLSLVSFPCGSVELRAKHFGLKGNGLSLFLETPQGFGAGSALTRLPLLVVSFHCGSEGQHHRDDQSNQDDVLIGDYDGPLA